MDAVRVKEEVEHELNLDDMMAWDEDEDEDDGMGELNWGGMRKGHGKSNGASMVGRYGVGHRNEKDSLSNGYVKVTATSREIHLQVVMAMRYPADDTTQLQYQYQTDLEKYPTGKAKGLLSRKQRENRWTSNGTARFPMELKSSRC